MTDTPEPASFRLAYVPGVTPSKWARVWNERLPGTPLSLALVPAGEAEASLRAETADAGLVRLPVDRQGLHAIPLYTETTVVVLPKDHRLAEDAEAAELGLADLAEELVLHPQDDALVWESLPGLAAKERPATTRDAVELVAAGVGVVIVPQSLARLHHRRDLTYRPLADAPQSQVALAWLEDRTTDLVEEFIGVVRGRTVNSSRGNTAAAAANTAAKKPAARKPAPQQAGQKQGGQKQGGQKQGGGRGRPTAKKAAPKRGKPGRRS
ncbi:LysR substrate-binding domain-containing protein [Streptacidiphilus rugosus]|uniref:LysR substrate-binding domain-containing protein n=1 Tax=Streptacidiphilus rugosus TaxID=405783 RepID=UPI00055CB462|nr:LysR substrate-binding domain-containing protein [Streptacidiphilus rugosus]